MTYYFTFGCGQPHEGMCQPIVAESADLARQKMVEVYGVKWAFQYTSAEWEANKADHRFPTERELPVIRS